MMMIVATMMMMIDDDVINDEGSDRAKEYLKDDRHIRGIE